MKKLVVSFAVLALLAAGVAWFLLRHSTLTRMAPAELVPGSTLAYAEVTDFRRTRERWMHTALRELWLEPEVQDFLQQPLAKVPQLAAAAKYAALLDQVQPRQGFAALTALEGNTPRFVAGLAFSGSRSALEALLAEPRAALRRQYPAGKSDLVTWGAAEIQTFTAGETVVAETVRDGWYFMANDVAALKALLDRYAGKAADPKATLAEDETFQKTLRPLPTDAEVVGFLRTEPLYERVSTLLSASGQNMDPATMAEWKKRRGLGFASRIEGTAFKDSLFLYAPGTAPEPKLPLSGLAFTSPGTLLFYDTLLPADLGGPMAAVAKAAGVDFTDAAPLLAKLGPEMSLTLDWPDAAEVSGLLAFPIQTPADDAPALVAALGASHGWTAEVKDGVTVYTAKPIGLIPLAPSFTVTGQTLFAGLNPAALQAAATRRGGQTLADSPAWQAAMKDVPPPAGNFLFLNTAALAERLYGTSRPLLAMGLAVNPATMPYLDASKLPSSAALSRHLGAATLTRTVTPEGQLVVSQGALTIPQMVAVLASAGGAAFPALSDSLPPGLLPPGLLPPPAISQPEPAPLSH